MRFDVATNELCTFCCSLAGKYELDLKDPKLNATGPSHVASGYKLNMRALDAYVI